MSLHGCSKCLKWLFVTLNVIFLLLGIVLMGIGIWLVADARIQGTVYFEHEELASFYIALTCAFLIIMVAIVGLAASLKESQGLLVGYFFGMLVVGAMEAAIVVIGFDLIIRKFSMNYRKTHILLGVSITFLLLQIIASSISIVLCCAVRKMKELSISSRP